MFHRELSLLCRPLTFFCTDDSCPKMKSDAKYKLLHHHHSHHHHHHPHGSYCRHDFSYDHCAYVDIVTYGRMAWNTWRPQKCLHRRTFKPFCTHCHLNWTTRRSSRSRCLVNTLSTSDTSWQRSTLDSCMCTDTSTTIISCISTSIIYHSIYITVSSIYCTSCSSSTSSMWKCWSHWDILSKALSSMINWSMEIKLHSTSNRNKDMTSSKSSCQTKSSFGPRRRTSLVCPCWPSLSSSLCWLHYYYRYTVIIITIITIIIIIIIIMTPIFLFTFSNVCW